MCDLEQFPKIQSHIVVYSICVCICESVYKCRVYGVCVGVCICSTCICAHNIQYVQVNVLCKNVDSKQYALYVYQ